MSKKKQKSSNKAERNKEALLKARTLAEAKTKLETKKEETTVETTKESSNKMPNIVGVSFNNREGEPINCLPYGKTAIETYRLLKKAPNAAPVSHKLEKDEKGIESIRIVYKNNNSKETVELFFHTNQLKPEDDIDLEKMRNPEQPIPAKVPEKKETKSETKIEKKEEKKETKKTTKSKKKEEVITPEEIEEVDVSDMPTIQIPKTTTPTNLGKSSGDRIDANRSVDLMNAVIRRREEIKDTQPAVYQAAGKQVDLMMWRLLQQWNSQLADDAAEAGIAVNPEMMEYLNSTASLFLGIQALPSKTKDGQLSIDFKEAYKQIPAETKVALKQDAAATAKQKEEVKIPTPEECTTEEQKLNAIRTISNVRGVGKGTMGRNLQNVVDFAKSAYKLPEDCEPAQAIAVVLKKFEEAGQATSLFEGFGNAIFGNLTGNMSALAAHSWLKGQLTIYNDSQIANVAKVFLAKKIKAEAEKQKKDDAALLKSYGALLGGLNDDLINRIIASANDSGKDEDKLIYETLKSVDIPEIKGKHISAVKTVNNMRAAYGSAMSDKLMKQKMQQITAFYADGMISPLITYTEKSAYAQK